MFDLNEQMRVFLHTAVTDRLRDLVAKAPGCAERCLHSAMQPCPLPAVGRVLAVMTNGAIMENERLQTSRRHPNGSIRPAPRRNRASGFRKVLIDLQGPHLRCNLLLYRQLNVAERKGDSRFGVTGRRRTAKSAPAEVLLSGQINIPPPMVRTRISG